VMIHSCGDVDELFDDLIDLGLNCFNPFQPEVMDVFEIHKKYYGKISFLGGLSIQKTLPYGSVADVKNDSFELLSNLGRKGGYIFSPSHALTGDIPNENIKELIHIAQSQ